MKEIIGLIGVFILLVACHNKPVSSVDTEKDKVVYLLQDKEIAEQKLAEFKNDSKSEIGPLVLKVALSFLETPYVAHTLESGANEEMVVNLRGLDCTTYAENVLALARTIKSDEQSFGNFVKELENIRYRDGKRDGYLSRLHYFSDWIYENNRRGIVRDVSQEAGGTPYSGKVDFMSTHPDSYKVLKGNPELLPALKRIEQEVSARSYFYIPKQDLAKYESKLKDGDIVALTTQIAGLDVTHVGLVVWKENRVHLLHASSTGEKVVISDGPLETYLSESRSTTGIMVVRAVE